MGQISISKVIYVYWGQLGTSRMSGWHFPNRFSYHRRSGLHGFLYIRYSGDKYTGHSVGISW